MDEFVVREAMFPGVDLVQRVNPCAGQSNTSVGINVAPGIQVLCGDHDNSGANNN